jgi:hypothetical protein
MQSIRTRYRRAHVRGFRDFRPSWCTVTLIFERYPWKDSVLLDMDKIASIFGMAVYYSRGTIPRRAENTSQTLEARESLAAFEHLGGFVWALVGGFVWACSRRVVKIRPVVSSGRQDTAKSPRTGRHENPFHRQQEHGLQYSSFREEFPSEHHCSVRVQRTRVTRKGTGTIYCLQGLGIQRV